MTAAQWIAVMVALVSAGTALAWAILRVNDEYNPDADMGAEDKE